MYNERESRNSRHKIALDVLTCRWNQSVKVFLFGKRGYYTIFFLAHCNTVNLYNTQYIHDIYICKHLIECYIFPTKPQATVEFLA